MLDVRDDASIAAAFAQTAQRFGGIVINNANVISLTGTPKCREAHRSYVRYERLVLAALAAFSIAC